MSTQQALVVGASSEIGTAVAVVLARLDHSPVLIGRHEGRLALAAAACEAALQAGRSVTTRNRRRHRPR